MLESDGVPPRAEAVTLPVSDDATLADGTLVIDGASLSVLDTVDDAVDTSETVEYKDSDAAVVTVGASLDVGEWDKEGDDDVESVLNAE